MRRICLSVVGMFLIFFHAFSQTTAPAADDYKSMQLKVEEVNIVSGYYTQSGNHSPVTGGIGTQQLTDISNTINLKLVNWDIFNRKHSYEFELGLDHHTAASSAYVSKTGASKTGGTRVYPSFNWKIENEAKRTSFGWGASYSHEYTYQSFGGNIQFSKKSKDNNREFDAKAHIYLDAVKMVEPSELRPAPVIVTSASGSGSSSKNNVPSSSRKTFDASLSLSQVINKRMQVSLLADGVAQQGYLGLPFYRVYFKDGSVHIENMPSTRFKLPLGVRLNYYIGDKFIIRSYYRFYTDNWGVTSHTASIETPFKITPFVSISPFYRYYTQTAANFFGAYETHTAADKYYTSNYDYASLNSNYEGVNLRIAPPKGVFGAKNFSILELRYGHYQQTTGLLANNISLNLTFK